MSGRGGNSEADRVLSRLEEEVVAEVEARLDAEGELALEPGLLPLFRGNRAQREEWARRNLGVRLGRAVGRETKDKSDADLFDRVQASTRRILAQLAAEQAEIGPLVAPLVVLPAARRWEIVTSQPRLRVLRAVTGLLDGAELLADAGVDELEELALAALHLAERLPARRYSRAMLYDLHARAWLLRVEVALARGGREDADFALRQVQHFQTEGSGDTRILFDTGRATAWLEWSAGDLTTAAETFRVLARRASQVHDEEGTAEAWLWAALVQASRGDEQAAGKARGRAEGQVGAVAARELARRVEGTARRLQLGAPTATPLPAEATTE